MPEETRLFIQMDPDGEEIPPTSPFAKYQVTPLTGEHLSLDELTSLLPKFLYLSDGHLYELKGHIDRHKVVHARQMAAPASDIESLIQPSPKAATSPSPAPAPDVNPPKPAPAAAAAAEPPKTVEAAKPAAATAAPAPAAPAVPAAPAAPKVTSKINAPGGGEGLKKVAQQLSLKNEDPFLKLVRANRENPEDFGIRQSLIKNSGDFYMKAALAFKENRTPELRALLRFRALLDTWFLTEEEIAVYHKLIDHKESSENIFYADEWLEMLYAGTVAYTFDETKRTEIYRLTKKPVNTPQLYNKGMADLMGSEEAALKFEMETVFFQWPFLCIGRRGNHFPFLETGMVTGNPADMMAKKREVNRQMQEMEKVDNKLFIREVLGKTESGQEGFIELHQQPYVILASCVAQNAICWDAWHRCDKRASRGRVSIPVFPEKGLDEVLVKAMGDYRWTLAKDSAMDWVGEGITGNYFAFYSEEKKKPADESAIDKALPLKENFMREYATWLKWESKGIQKINKDLRPIFWRYVPFGPELREKLSKVAPVYADLASKSPMWEKQDAKAKKQSRG